MHIFSMKEFNKEFEKHGCPRGWSETMAPPVYVKSWLEKIARQKEISNQQLVSRFEKNAEEHNMPLGIYMEERCAADNGWDISSYWKARFDKVIDLSNIELNPFSILNLDFTKAVKVFIKFTSGYESVESAFEEVIKLTDHSVSYKYIPEKNEDSSEKNYPGWKFLTHSELLGYYYKWTIFEVEKVIKDNNEIFAVDTGEIEFSIEYNNGYKVRKAFQDNGESFYDILKLIKEVTPAIADTPKLLEVLDEVENEKRECNSIKLEEFYDFFSRPEFATNEWAKYKDNDIYYHYPSSEYSLMVHEFEDWFFEESGYAVRCYWDKITASPLFKIPINIRTFDNVDKLDGELIKAFITAIFRIDRTEEGTVAEAFEYGLMTKLIAKLREEI